MGLEKFGPIGEPFITCLYCGQKIRSGKNYWCDMTPEEKAKAKAAMVESGIFQFILLSVIIFCVGLITFEERLLYWVAPLVAAPIAYFLGTRNFNRLKKLKPPSDKHTKDD